MGFTYSCLFTGSEGDFTLMVPAIVVMAGSQYKCNITGSIELDTVQKSLFLCVCVTSSLYYVTMLLTLCYFHRP